MNKGSDQTQIPFNRQKIGNITPDILVKSFWVSTALAIILTLPSLGVFIGISQKSGNLLIASILGFGLHFILLSLSSRISSALTSIFDN